MRVAVVAGLISAYLVAGSAAAKERTIEITEPKDGATVTSPFTVKFAARGVKVVPAGTPAPGEGHHHLLINGDPLPPGTEVPFDKAHLHFGKGQTEAQVSLPPGVYKLTAQFADGEHKSLGPNFAHTIRVTVR
jgi:hypothetical protein